jgi:hypothetical protein
MKKTIALATVLLALTAGQALADNDIGCGFGTQLMAGNEGVAPKVLGATTNGTLGNQTFGISSGTLGCKQNGTVTVDARLNMFAGANLDHLAQDMARGQGESLQALADLMQIPDSDKPAFFRFTKAHFGEIFSSDETTAGDMLTSLNGLMAKDATLAVYAKI